MRSWSWMLPLLLMVGCREAREIGQQAPDTSEQFYAPYTNLQVLPTNVRWAELQEAMLENLRGLGLRQTAGEGCLHCHVGSLETPMETWSFASDAKRAKRTARVMMQMVQSINETYLSRLENRDSAPQVVTCFTCHKGLINPRPLLAVLDGHWASGGMEEVAQAYGTLRSEYYGRGVYDFDRALVDFGVTLADRGNYDDAIRALRLNLQFESDSPDAHRWLIRLVMEKAAPRSGIDDLRALYDSLAAVERPDGALVWYTVRAVGVRLRRGGQVAAAATAFAVNEQLYPDDHRVITDLALTRLMLGDTAAAVAGARRALSLQPDYDVARELLDDLAAQR